MAFDFPGLGLADRPEDFDYSWSGLRAGSERRSTRSGSTAATSSSTTSAGRSRCEWAVRNPERVLSLTALNTLLGVASFSAPGRCSRSRSAASARCGLARFARWPMSAAPLPAGSRQPRGDASPRGLRPLLPAEARRRRPGVPADHAGLRADRGRSSASSGRGWPSGPTRRGSSGASATRRSASTSCRLVQEALEVPRPDPAAGQALPAGGPGDPGRQRDHRLGRAAGLRRRIALRPTPGRGRRSRAASAPRVRGTGSPRRRSRAAPRHPGTPRAPRRALRARRSATRCAPG